jgi:hypothetical protein
MIFDIRVEEIHERVSLPWVVTLSLGEKTIECYFRTREKAMALAEKYQKRGWSKVPPSQYFLKYMGALQE